MLDSLMSIMISCSFKGLRTLLVNAMAVYMIPQMLLLFDTLGAESSSCPSYQPLEY